MCLNAKKNTGSFKISRLFSLFDIYTGTGLQMSRENYTFIYTFTRSFIKVWFGEGLLCNHDLRNSNDLFQKQFFYIYWISTLCPTRHIPVHSFPFYLSHSFCLSWYFHLILPSPLKGIMHYPLVSVAPISMVQAVTTSLYYGERDG